MRVMVADRQIEHRLKILEFITELNCQVVEASTAAELLNLTREACPELFLLCVDTLSFETVRQLRKLGGQAVWNSVVLMKANVTEADRMLAAEVGADDLLDKPISYGQLALKLESVARQKNVSEHVMASAQELKQPRHALEAVSIQDSLTGLGNSNHFDDALEVQWFQNRKDKTPLSYIYLNLDYFRAFNDAYGPEQGDACLKQVASLIRQLVPDPSLAARVVASSFAILLPNTDSRQAQALAEQLRLRIFDLQIPHNSSGAAHFVTASLGVSTVSSPHYKQPWDLNDSADFALYQAKHQGHNRVVFLASHEVKMSG